MRDGPGDTLPAVPSARTILGATLLALILAATVLVVAVLPAEYGIDPLGVGRRLSLTDLGGESRRAIAPQPEAYRRDAVEFVLGPYETVEYKYRLEAGGGLLYSWNATAPVRYDFHGEPDEAPKGYAESFDRQQAAEANGTFFAPFSGVHGWYWENDGTGDVTIRLTTAGFYSAAWEYFDGGVFPRELSSDR